MDVTENQTTTLRAKSQHPPVVFTLKIRGGRGRDEVMKGKGGRGPLVQENLSATLGVSQDQYLFAPRYVNSLGGGHSRNA